MEDSINLWNSENTTEVLFQKGLRRQFFFSTEFEKAKLLLCLKNYIDMEKKINNTLARVLKFEVQESEIVVFFCVGHTIQEYYNNLESISKQRRFLVARRLVQVMSTLEKYQVLKNQAHLDTWSFSVDNVNNKPIVTFLPNDMYDFETPAVQDDDDDDSSSITSTVIETNVNEQRRSAMERIFRIILNIPGNKTLLKYALFIVKKFERLDLLAVGLLGLTKEMVPTWNDLYEFWSFEDATATEKLLFIFSISNYGKQRHYGARKFKLELDILVKFVVREAPHSWISKISPTFHKEMIHPPHMLETVEFVAEDDMPISGEQMSMECTPTDQPEMKSDLVQYIILHNGHSLLSCCDCCRNCYSHIGHKPDYLAKYCTPIPQSQIDMWEQVSGRFFSTVYLVAQCSSSYKRKHPHTFKSTYNFPSVKELVPSALLLENPLERTSITTPTRRPKQAKRKSSPQRINPDLSTTSTHQSSASTSMMSGVMPTCQGDSTTSLSWTSPILAGNMSNVTSPGSAESKIMQTSVPKKRKISATAISATASAIIAPSVNASSSLEVINQEVAPAANPSREASAGSTHTGTLNKAVKKKKAPKFFKRKLYR